MQGIFRKENTDKALKYGIYRHLPTYEKIIRNLVSFSIKNTKTDSVIKSTQPEFVQWHPLNILFLFSFIIINFFRVNHC